RIAGALTTSIDAAAITSAAVSSVIAASARFEKFLGATELGLLRRFVVAHERAFVWSRVMEGESAAGVVNRDLRRSRVLDDMGDIEALFASRLAASLPEAARRLGMAAFPPSRIEMQIAGYHDGGFFGRHRDTDPDHFPSRALTFVYFVYSG